jgi:uncharacterized protein YkwD
VARVAFAAFLAVLCGCAKNPPYVPGGPDAPDAWISENAPPPPLADPSARDAPQWARDTRTERLAAGSGDPCSEYDPRLIALARELATRPFEPISPETLIFELRRRGSPYVWPATNRIIANDNDPERTRSRMAAWAADIDGSQTVRCGMATTVVDGEARTVGIATTPIAELAPLPTQVHTGRWLVVRGALHSGIADAQVIVMGPTGRPQPLTTSSENGRFRATFAADQPGRWVVQVVASGAGGPRPALEAWVYADVTPQASPSEAPSASADAKAGENADSPGLSDADRIRGMVQAARQRGGARKLRRNPQLDALALAHAESMRSKGVAAHDVGDGDAADRARRANFNFKLLGENFAQATSPETAHRALWASPGHRSTILDPRFREFGIAAVRSPDGTLWVCQLFATLKR